MKTTEIPNIKFTVSVWPNMIADAMPVNIVATVDEYFFKIVSGNILKKPLMSTFIMTLTISYSW